MSTKAEKAAKLAKSISSYSLCESCCNISLSGFRLFGKLQLSSNLEEEEESEQLESGTKETSIPMSSTLHVSAVTDMQVEEAGARTTGIVLLTGESDES